MVQHSINGYGPTLYFLHGYISTIWFLCTSKYVVIVVCQMGIWKPQSVKLKCPVWGVFGLPTFCWPSYAPIFYVPGLGNTWSANVSLELIFPYFWGARFGEYLVCQLFVGPHIPLFLRCQVLGSTWSANFSLDLISPYFWGARFGEYLVCQLFVGPHIPLFLRCQVWGVPGLPTFSWTSYSPIFEVPGLGSTWYANFSLDLIFPYFWGAWFGEYLVCQLFVGPRITLFLRCQVWGVPGLPIFHWNSYSPIFEVPHSRF